MLTLNTNILNKKETISSTDAEFENTSLFDTGFEIDVKNLGRTEKAKVMASLSGSENATMADYNKAILLASITDLRGVEIKNDTEIITDNDDKLKVFYEIAPDELINTIIKVVDKFSKVAKEKKSDSVQQQTNLPTGM